MRACRSSASSTCARSTPGPGPGGSSRSTSTWRTSPTGTGGNEFSADIAIPPGVVQALVGNDKLGGFLDTFRAQFSFSVSDGDPNDAYADKALVYSKRDHPPNHNPALTGLAVTRDGVPDPTVFVKGQLHLHLGVEYGLRPQLADGAQEEYDTTDLRG